MITSVTLTVTVDDLDLGATGNLTFADKDGIPHQLGSLDTMGFSDTFGLEAGLGNSVPGHITETTFLLQPEWLRVGNAALKSSGSSSTAS